MKNFDISAIFNKIADLLEIRGDNPFRVRAYRKAAFNIETLGKDVSGLSTADLMEIPGIGSDLASKIEEYLRSGRIDAYEKLRQEVPEGLADLLNVPGLGPKTVALFYRQYKVKDLEELERLARDHRLAGLPGIKEKTEGNIIKGIEMLRRASSHYPLGRILPMAEEIARYLRDKAPVDRIDVAGSIRRWKETVKDIDILSTSKDPGAVMLAFTRMPGVKETLMKGPTKSSVVMEEGIQVDIRVVEEDSYGSALAYFTGSKAHNIRLRELAAKAGMKLNEYGVFREKDGKKLGGREEGDIYRLLGLEYVPPELREDTGEIEAAAEGRLPRLVELSDIRGDLHLHTSWSDGSQSIEDLAETSIKRGYRYAAVTDHSKGLGVAHGLNEERILEQLKLIEGLNRRLKSFRVLSGVEINIKTDGSLDFDADLLRRLDIVVASVHSGFKQPGERITKRIVTAMQNPYVSIIAHPTGRLIGEREAYEMDMDAVLQAASRTGTAIEINAYPLRLDLSESYARAARAKNVPLVISTDSHTAGQFQNMAFGVGVARRGWLEKSDVANTLDCDGLLAVLQKKRLKK